MHRFRWTLPTWAVLLMLGSPDGKKPSVWPDSSWFLRSSFLLLQHHLPRAFEFCCLASIRFPPLLFQLSTLPIRCFCRCSLSSLPIPLTLRRHLCLRRKLSQPFLLRSFGCSFRFGPLPCLFLLRRFALCFRCCLNLRVARPPPAILSAPSPG
eukprot:COSAG03_NODE_7_length_25331_cov_113.442375_11_plen_153_part_00